jgi:hypothetical protein
MIPVDITIHYGKMNLAVRNRYRLRFERAGCLGYSIRDSGNAKYIGAARRW